MNAFLLSMSVYNDLQVICGTISVSMRVIIGEPRIVRVGGNHRVVWVLGICVVLTLFFARKIRVGFFGRYKHSFVLYFQNFFFFWEF